MAEPRRLGRYLVGEKIGEGGMADVYRAETEGTGSRPLVVKRLRRVWADEPEVARMLAEEAALATRLHHGGIVQLHEHAVDEDGLPYLVMELVDGVSLDSLQAELELRGDKLSIAESLTIVERITDALSYAHRLRDESGSPLGLVHRDVTPRNVLISREGVVKLADFGIAKTHAPTRTLPGVIKGSVGYMSPEQAAGAPVDARTDQFAAGVILYELLSGTNPYRDVTNLDRLKVTLERPLPSLPHERGIDDELDSIVRRATAFSPVDRFATTDDFHAALEAWRVKKGLRSATTELATRVQRIRGERVAPPRALVVDDEPAHVTHVATPRAPSRAPLFKIIAAAAALTALVIIGVALLAFKSRSNAPIAIPSPSPSPSPSPTPTPTPTPTSRTPDSRDPEPPDSRDPEPPDPRNRETSAPAGGPRSSSRSGPRSGVGGPDADVAKGRLKVNVIPYARISVDGVDVGATPVDVPIDAGRHTIVLHNPDTGQRETRTIDVKAGRTIDMTSW